MKTLTEAETFDADIEVPEGTDDMNTHAEDLEGFVQKLANRTAYLREIADNAARKDEENVFTAGAQFIDPPEADYPMIASHRSADTVDSGNQWMKVHEFKLGEAAAHYWRLYVGVGSDKWAITENAKWHIPTQKWRQDDDGQDSIGLVATGSGLQFGRVLAGESPWDSWPTPAGTTLGLYDLIAAGAVLCDAGFLVSTGEFSYSTARQRTTPLEHDHAIGAYQVNSDGSIQPTSGSAIEIPVRLPAGTVLDRIDVMVEQAGTGLSLCDFQQRGPGIQWNTYPVAAVPPDAPGTGATIIASANAAASATVQTVPIIFGAPHTILATRVYRIRFTRAQAGDKIHAIQAVNWEDPGPRNY